MIAEVLRGGRRCDCVELDGIAYGRGPGAFTGVRIAIGVVQGLAFGVQSPTVGVSDLAAVAQQTAQTGRGNARVHGCTHGRGVLGPLRAHAETDLVRAVDRERVDRRRQRS